MKLLTAVTLLAASLSLSEGIMVCYYGSWAVYRQGKGKFDVEDIDPFLCTHIVFGFAGLGSDNKIAVLDPWNELCDNYGKCGYDRFTALKNTNPNLVTTLAVGGWNEGSAKYSAMAADAGSRQTFISSSIELLKDHNFDGLDMDWEYPTDRGGAPEDKANFPILMRELSDALHAEGLILTAAVSAGEGTINAAYDVPSIAASVDYLHIMTYDMHGAWETYTHHQSILYAYPGDEDRGDTANFNVDFAIQYWMSLGAPANKIVMGVPTYGRCFRLDSIDNHGMIAPASQPGSAGPYTMTPGTLGYNEMCEEQLLSPWTIVRESDMNEPYAYNPDFGNTWCGYDEPSSASTKATYAKANGLAGMMVWSLETDDFLGECGRTFNLIKTLVEAFTGAPFTTPEPASTTTRDPNEPTDPPTDPPTTITFPTAAPGEHCSKPGNNADPYDCSFFYQCVYTGTGYIETITYCSPGTLFNPYSMICDYDYSVCALGGGECPVNCPL